MNTHLRCERGEECEIIYILTFSLDNPFLRGKTIIFSLNLQNQKGLITLTFPRKLLNSSLLLRSLNLFFRKGRDFFHDSTVVLESLSMEKRKTENFLLCWGILIQMDLFVQSLQTDCFILFYTTDHNTVLGPIIIDTQ